MDTFRYGLTLMPLQAGDCSAQDRWCRERGNCSAILGRVGANGPLLSLAGSHPLVFDTGDDLNLPSIKVGGFDAAEKSLMEQIDRGQTLDLSNFGDGIDVDWLKERAKLNSG